MSERPEHEKLRAVKDKSQAIGEFVAWLRDEKGYEICARADFGDQDYYPVLQSIEQLLAEHFEIDLDRLESEKRAMLEELRKFNSKGAA